MYAVVTGAAGFIGSHLAEQLVARGDSVLGIDCFTNYYDVAAKRANVRRVSASARFELAESDLRTCDLVSLFSGADAIFHQAGQPGVRSSWSDGFRDYVDHNVLATQRVLEAALAAGVGRVVYASSSSVYGNALAYPVSEADLPRPESPYGVTKLAAEHLCSLYAANYGLSTVSLRYFTVYGPRQRPDMAFRRLVESALTGQPFPLYGTGHQVRDFTYVDDVVGANLLALAPEIPAGSVMNVAGGTHAEMLQVIDLVADLVGRPVSLDRHPRQAGDVDRTEASVKRATALLGWQPEVPLSEGLSTMVEWVRSQS
ncbi:MAG: Nucleoside-diphosphate-sugar epimerase [Acidimicrobiaceae bacterium]|nr:Nucleoside-diphosphate-sugar epimerase [Acidimicrobiaceae bacterium]